jgi:hypothetical protein
VYLRRANHNFFNSGLADEGGHGRRECKPRSKRLTRAAQNAWLARYAPAFFRAMLAGGLAVRAANLDAGAPVRRWVYGRRALTSVLVPRKDRLVLQTGSPDVTPGVAADHCPRGRPCRPGLWQPTYPPQLVVSWSGRRGGTFTSSFDAPRDVRGFDAVRLRVAVDPTNKINPRWRPQAFSLVLRDAGGRSDAARVRKTAPALGFPPGRFGPATKELSYVIGSDLRVPLGAFRGLSLRRLVSISLRFDPTPRGSILLANLELVRGSPPS